MSNETIANASIEQASGTVLEFPTVSGHTVSVIAAPGALSSPYHWECSAGDALVEYAYKSLPAARDDAKAHAAVCRTPGAIEEPRTITYPIKGGGSLTSTCPAWCAYDHTHDVADGINPGDLFHQSDAVSVDYSVQGVEQSILDARIAQWPHSQDDPKPYIELVPEGRTGAGLILTSRAELDEEIRRVRAHLDALQELGEHFGEARANDHARHVEDAVTAWMTLQDDDLQSMPIAYLLKVFGVSVVETEDIGRKAVAALYGEPGAMELRIKPDMSQYMREDQARRLLVDWMDSHCQGGDL